MDVNILMLTAAILGECPIWGSKAAACCSFGRSAPGPFVLFLIPALCIVAALMLRCVRLHACRRRPFLQPRLPLQRAGHLEAHVDVVHLDVQLLLL
ncbi:uncharacterized protein [Aegilops tauschii subsp. strangulata]|uniref:uncharacterized protein isoform X3 n=1 Tax=Aegilops tauschii subsp. strangulata TaxID=200361 RepID=UPI003CC851F8